MILDLLSTYVATELYLQIYGWAAIAVLSTKELGAGVAVL